MSTFTDFNGPQSGPSSASMIQYANAYAELKNKLEAHIDKELSEADQSDPHKVKSYIDSSINSLDKAQSNTNNAVKRIFKYLTGIEDLPVSVQDIQDHIKSKIGDNTDLISFVMTLVKRITELEDQLHTLSLLQFDNVPVGSGIRWWKDTLPEDGTYVWANGQTLYGVNQNFPELARVWELDSSDNVKVPKEDHTIFKVRKATVEIRPIEHAYIATASGEDTPSNP